MSETSQEDAHHHDERLRPKIPDEHSGNQDLQALLHRRQEAEEKLKERQAEADRRAAAGRGGSTDRGGSGEGADAEDSSPEDGTDTEDGTDAGDPSRGD